MWFRVKCIIEIWVQLYRGWEGNGYEKTEETEVDEKSSLTYLEAKVTNIL